MVLVWELYAIVESQIDNYEGFPTFYGKDAFRIEMEGKKIRAMAYVMKWGVPLSVPDRNYYEGILEGYLAAGFDQAILDEAVRVSDPEPRDVGACCDCWFKQSYRRIPERKDPMDLGGKPSFPSYTRRTKALEAKS